MKDNPELDALLETLIANSATITETEYQAYESALAAIAAYPQSRINLEKLLLAFNDRCDTLDSMWQLVHYVEHFDMETYIRALVKITNRALC
jgi:hypothetical protein